MPMNNSVEIVDGEKKGYYQYGETGKRYYYEIGNKESRTIARQKAEKQARAINARR